MNERSADLSAAVLISGSGSNLQAFIDATASGELSLNLCVVLSNKPTAGGLDRAREAGISVECIAHQDFPERSLFDAALVETLDKYQPDLIILAGFMRILTTTFVDHFAGRGHVDERGRVSVQFALVLLVRALVLAHSPRDKSASIFAEDG